jgi:hypothetical protein
MPGMGFEPTIPTSERVKTVHALDRAATVIDKFGYTRIYTYIFFRKVPAQSMTYSGF